MNARMHECHTTPLPWPDQPLPDGDGDGKSENENAAVAMHPGSFTATLEAATTPHHTYSPAASKCLLKIDDASKSKCHATLRTYLRKGIRSHSLTHSRLSLSFTHSLPPLRLE
eukprot:GHVU01006021.1.p1 GENE.GHVU01006021.1~~GHVU01006021.1.p1  ORF type:complete len:113 (-),score=5.70 GHVU01006021.1:164-502(-)